MRTGGAPLSACSRETIISSSYLKGMCLAFRCSHVKQAVSKEICQLQSYHRMCGNSVTRSTGYKQKALIR